MKKYYILPVLFVLTLSIKFISCASTKSCSRLKTGHFFYFDKIDRHKIEIYRDDTVQVETDAKTGSIIQTKIKWIDNCRYELIVKGTKNDSTRLDIPIHFEIISVKKTFYLYKAISFLDGKQFEVSDTLFFE